MSGTSHLVIIRSLIFTFEPDGPPVMGFEQRCEEACPVS